MVTQKEIAEIISKEILTDKRGAVAGLVGYLQYLVDSGKYSLPTAKEKYGEVSRIVTNSLIRRRVIPEYSHNPKIQTMVITRVAREFGPIVKEMQGKSRKSVRRT